MKSKKENKKAIHKELTLNANINQLWNAWTDPKELTQFFAPVVEVELRVGGPYEMLFLTDNPEGQRGGEGNKVLSFLTNKMLSFEWNAPPQFPKIREHKTRVIIFFEEIDEENCLLNFHHVGWYDGIEWDMVFDYFTKAWDTVLYNLKQYLEN